MRKAQFHDVWEINFLYTSIPSILDLTLKVVDVGRSQEIIKEE